MLTSQLVVQAITRSSLEREISGLNTMWQMKQGVRYRFRRKRY